jgi:CBS-domain-containing membrane protein
MQPIEHIGRGLVAALISLTVAVVVLAHPLVALAGSGNPGGV